MICAQILSIILMQQDQKYTVEKKITKTTLLVHFIYALIWIRSYIHKENFYQLIGQSTNQSTYPLNSSQ